MPASPRLPLALALLLAVATPLAAAEIAAPAAHCHFRAWSKDPDPAGLNVRAAPRRDAPVVARLPPPRGANEDRRAVEFQVIGGDGPWLLIEGAEFADYGDGTKGVYRGRGWVAAALVDVSVQDEKVRLGPASDAGIADQPRPTGDDTYEYLSLRRILGCRDRWIEMEGEFRADADKPGRAVRGWVTDLCGNQVTTCN